MVVGRSDPNDPLVIAIREFARSKAKTPDDDAIWIFWEAHRSVSGRSAPTDDSVLECLASLYGSHHVSYEPDDGTDNLIELLTFLHIAAARALEVKQRNGLSEEVTDCLHEVERTMGRLSLWIPGDPPDLTEGFASLISAVATSGIVFVELSNVCRSEHRYADALGYLARATRYYDEAAECNAALDPSLWDNRLEVETQLQRRLKAHLDALKVSLEDAKGLFDQVKANRRRVDDWRQVADDCRALMNALHVSGVDDEIQDERGDMIGWRECWNGAQTWARAQLSPTELQEYHSRDEEEAARDRMRLYFFGETWATLTCRAQAAIVNADLHMHSKERRQRLEAIINELRIATEEIFNQGLWKPLATVGPAEWFPELDRFEDRRAGLHPRSRDPGLKDFEWACSQPFFRMFLEKRSLESSEIEFLTQDLPVLCQQLRRHRNSSEHSLDTISSRVAVDDVFRKLLGINREGVLPELARIGKRMRGDGLGRRK